jgi:transposase-like protein
MIPEKMKAASGIETGPRAIENSWKEAAPAKETGSHLVSAIVPPNPEVPAKATRRRFTAHYKLHILEMADACTEPGSLGALLRREGLYASNLTTWRRQREQGILWGLAPKNRGRKESVRNPLIEDNEKLRRENERLRERLRRAEIIIDVQKKVSQMLEAPLERTEGGGNE